MAAQIVFKVQYSEGAKIIVVFKQAQDSIQSWNNGKEVPRLDLTSSTMPGQQIHVIGCRVAVPRSHWSAVPTLLFIYISQLLRD